ncbi:MAG: M24 family metallopeptidase [Chloroflexota bacterium]|nr:M24 family metallopeptidase [Chloroflexota bacterium]
MTEQEQKEARVRELLEERGLDGLLLRRASSFSWATCGASSYINTASDYGEAALLYAPGHRYLIANNIEAPRLAHEEGLAAQGWEFLTYDWYSPDSPLDRVTEGMRLGADHPHPDADDVSADVSRLRAQLTPEEGQRFRDLGQLCGEAMGAAIAQVRPGQTEHEIAGILSRESATRGAWPVVDLVATDERIFAYRHPLPTSKQLERYAMLVLCGRMHGLVCSITRLVHFGSLPDELRRKQEAVLRVDAAFLSATRPGATLRDVFERAVREYAAVGYPDEWRLHHQGGTAGYEGREELGTPSASGTVIEGQAYAWNPSITGVKSEDTILIGADGNTAITQVPGWPAITVEVDGQSFERPTILEVR